MTWIQTPPLTRPDVADAVRDAMRDFPPEYGPAARAHRAIPAIARRDSIVGVHGLFPGVLRHVFAGYGAMMAPELPLSRRRQETIAVVVSVLNRCFY